jgi:transcriptional regulator with XRE-family HTH domain
MTDKLNPIKAWMSKATVEQQEELAAMVGTSRGTLYLYASGNRTPSSSRAIEIEAATMEMAEKTNGSLPVLYRTDMSSACASCHFARQCLGMKSEFPVLN